MSGARLIEKFCRDSRKKYLNLLSMKDREDVIKLVNALKDKHKPTRLNDTFLFDELEMWVRNQMIYVRPQELSNLSEKSVKKSIESKLKNLKISQVSIERYNSTKIVNMIDFKRRKPGTSIIPPAPENLIKNLLIKHKSFQFDSKIFYQIPVQVALDREKYGPKCMSDMLAYLGFENLPESTMYDLIWYLYLYNHPLKVGLTNAENKYLSKLSREKLVELIKSKSNMLIKGNPGFTRASALFTLNSGIVIPGILETEINSDNYAKAEILPSNLIMYIVKHSEAYHRDKKPKITSTIFLRLMRGPYYSIGQLFYHFYDDIIRVNNKLYIQALYDLYQKHPILTDRIIRDLFSMQRTGFAYYINKYMTDKDSYVNRLINLDNKHELDNIPPLSSIDHPRVYKMLVNTDNTNTVALMSKLLEKYTSMELYMYYDLPETEPSRIYREALILAILVSYTRIRWRFYDNGTCQNSSIENVITLETKSDMDKNDPVNPTFVYGVPGIGMCYQLDELMTAFEPIDGVYKFINPDFNQNNILVNDITNQPVTKEFTTESIQQLRELVYDRLDVIADESESIEYKNSLEKFLLLIDKGLEFKLDTNRQFNIYMQEYRKFDQKQTELVNEFFAWLFIFGMWMRYWRGPMYPWPERRITNISSKDRSKQGRCDAPERDQYVIIQSRVYNMFMEKFSQQGILDWLEKLPIIDYRFNTEQFTVSSIEKITEVITRITIGDYCQGIGGDKIPACAYIYITRKLSEHTLSDSDLVNYLQKYLPLLLDMDRVAVNSLLADFNPTELKPGETQPILIKILLERKKELDTKTSIKLPKFIPRNIEPNVHTSREQDI